MNSLEQRKSMLLHDIQKLQMELSKLKLPGRTESDFEMKESSDLGYTTINGVKHPLPNTQRQV